MKKTYRAIQISQPGVLELVRRDIPVPGPGEVLILVEACGMCGADLRDIQNAEPARQRVPGHEVVGRIIAIGSGTPWVKESAWGAWVAIATRVNRAVEGSSSYVRTSRLSAPVVMAVTQK